ncbi:MAG: D-cysteine desulfhydrase family protein [Rhizobiales bacterium]|nr:D-cysteine desulfhydrase family protein [Hyphomicrobiales bacterium]NRB15889.1 D-cysteine desulfhydrase family protein [Hyphomicrobiales bacterium]
MLTDNYPRVELSHTPTPLECLENLSQKLGGPKIWVKRDDCTGLAMGGNKVRQLEYYIGDAVSKGADTILTTGAMQSNQVRLTIAAARKLGLDVEVQLEERVGGRPQEYYNSGNPFLMKLMGAKIHHYADGEDEEGADRALYAYADEVSKAGKTPYVIPLSGDHIPYGSLGYVRCAEELVLQFHQRSLKIDGIILPTGSATTHAGILCGLRALNCNIPVYGFCVRRDQQSQAERVLAKAEKVAEMIGHPGIVTKQDIWTNDKMLYPGYGQLNDELEEAMRLAAVCEGLLLDPTYTGKTMAGLIDLIESGHFTPDQNIVFLHTGGTPALFGYPELIDKMLDEKQIKTAI